MTSRLSFAFAVAAGQAESQALMLARSIRTFGGRLADSPVWALVAGDAGQISKVGRQQLADLGAQLASFGIGPDALGFPLGAKAYGAAAAESLVLGHADLLVWIDTDSLVIQEPGPLLLEPGYALGYRPVDHTLIGSPYDEPIDLFWEAIYRQCGVPEDRLFPMIASVDRRRIRPYFNAGMLVVRPERDLLRSWRDNFEQLFRDPAFGTYYDENIRYKVFLHQAVLAGTVLASTERHELQELPHLVNYPLHMHAQYPADRRPGSLNDVVTCRYDVLLDDEDWRRVITINEPLRSWLEALIAKRRADARP